MMSFQSGYSFFRISLIGVPVIFIALLSSCRTNDCGDSSSRLKEYTSIQLITSDEKKVNRIFYPQVAQHLFAKDTSGLKEFFLLNGFDHTLLIFYFASGEVDTLDISYNRSALYNECGGFGLITDDLSVYYTSLGPFRLDDNDDRLYIY